MPTVSGVPILGGSIFNFTESGYTPPSSSGTIYNFQYSAYTLNQIWLDDDYVYAAVDYSLDVIDKVDEGKISYIHSPGGFNTVWANDDLVYLGTTLSGIKYFNKTCISGTVLIPGNIYTCLSDFVSPFGISSQNIRYLHGYSDDYLMCCTDLGVDVYYLKETKYRSTTTDSGTRKCFMTPTGRFYYTSVSGSEWSVNRLNTALTDWTTPDYKYYTGDGILSDGLEINDIFIEDTLFIATTSGLYIINEETLDYNIYFITTVSGGILPGNDNDFKAVWVDNGRIFIGSAGAFYVVIDGVLTDYYTITHKGRTNESLDQPDIIDVT